ncbi:unnamed protein product [Ectocarpus sp. 12 AP-2014]
MTLLSATYTPAFSCPANHATERTKRWARSSSLSAHLVDSLPLTYCKPLPLKSNFVPAPARCTLSYGGGKKCSWQAKLFHDRGTCSSRSKQQTYWMDTRGHKHDSS